MIDVGGPNPLGSAPGQVILDSIRKKAKEAVRSKSVSSIPLWSVI